LGVGKSKELFHGLLPRLPSEASVCLTAPNIALARKYHEETRKEGLDYVCYLDESGGKITARRVVVCINSIARVLPRFDLVVMDEVNFTLTNMASTVMKDKKLVFLALEGIVAGAKAAFLNDAHLNCPRVVEWIQTLRHASRFYTIRNRGVWPLKRKAFISPMPGPLVGRGQPKATYSLVVEGILDLIASGKTVMVSALRLPPRRSTCSPIYLRSRFSAPLKTTRENFASGYHKTYTYQRMNSFPARECASVTFTLPGPRPLTPKIRTTPEE
jgi:hypothetical protein